MGCSWTEGAETPTDRARAASRFHDHVDAIQCYLARRVGHDLAADLVADTFRIAIEQLAKYDASRGSERAWIFGIATIGSGPRYVPIIACRPERGANHDDDEIETFARARPDAVPLTGEERHQL